MLKVNITNGTIEENEKQAYIDHMRKAHPEITDGTLNITLDGDFVNLELSGINEPFQRIRRITGYLVGTLDRFNNAKRAEVGDRVKHGTQDEFHTNAEE